MKGFKRNNQLLSLCGLNCTLCPMYLGNHCCGCGNGNASCKLAKCSLDHGKIAYCFECSEYPCEKYDYIDDYDSFITHKNQKQHLEKAQKIGIDAYNIEQIEKARILNTLLQHYNDGRKKTFYCVAVNLLELSALKAIMEQISSNNAIESSDIHIKSKYAFDIFTEKAKELGMEFKLRKKK